MNDRHVSKIAAEVGCNGSQVQAVMSLFEQDSTIPFIARYRKEATGSLDEVALTAIRDMLSRLEELDNRKESILKSLEQHGHLTDDLKKDVTTAATLAVLEDIYLPYKPKRRTKAAIAREKGLEPLAFLIFDQDGSDPHFEGKNFIDPEKGVETVEDALSGAREIIAEIINEDQQARVALRDLFATKGIFKSKVVVGMESAGAKFKDYFDWEEPAVTAPSHRILAMRRGEKGDFLNLSLAPSAEDAIKILEEMFIKGEGPDSNQVRLALHDSYKRLLSRSMDTELRQSTKERADSEAIRVFAQNLRELLLASPLGPKRVMGIDPGFKTGCKLVCLDRQGKLLHHDVIYPNMSKKRSLEAAETLEELSKSYQIEAVATGNGTAGRETEAFIKNISAFKNIPVIMVNESGASIYSASEVARDEFPDFDLTVRGAVSIGRRLMDPLSELVKIDPKSIGVGQYQHDVDQSALKQSLDDIVISCVNSVGVDVNRASTQLLAYVSGLGERLAKKILDYRDENGPFKSRNELKKVSRLGPKAFEQSAGFLRIRDAANPLDASAVHPESYKIVDAMAGDLGCTVSDLMAKPELRSQINISNYVTKDFGTPTLKDILEELAKPGRDPREDFEDFAFADDVEKIDDLQPGMKLPGIITNVTNFGAFVDIGVHQDGLVHISEISDKFVKNPATVVKVNQKVSVTVIDIDLERNRIGLSLKTVPGRHDKKKKTAPAKKAISSQKIPKKAIFNIPFAELLKNKKI